LTVDASASTSSVGIASYLWNFGDNIIANGVTHVHYYEAGATYTVTLTVTDTLGQKNSVSQQIAVANSNVPPLPCVLFGDTYASDGSTPLGDCAIFVTDNRTGETLIGYTSDSGGSIYIDDIMPLYVVDGDTLIIQAVGPSGQTGSTSIVADLSTPYIGPVEVTLTVAIPEFTDIAIPIVGMISIFAVARVASNRSEEE